MNLATATDLERWADLREAQAALPQLVRRLISATANGLVSLSARAGEGVALPGWDGIAETRHGDAHVPEGKSAWEMGVTAEVTTKANEDYRKRTDNPGDIDPADATFVFVTPRRWPSKQDWARRKMEEGVWRRVVAYDADDLETWLERAPDVHAWMSAAVGKDPYEVESLATWWQWWSRATIPPFSPNLLLSGREAAATEVREKVGATHSSLTISGDSQEEVTAFIAAALQVGGGDDEPSPNLQRSLIVRTPAAWRRLAVSGRALILVPLFENPDVGLAVGHGHTVLIALGREVEARSGINLPRLRRDGIERALSELGLSPERSSTLATVGRRSLLSLRRALAIHPELERPEWARPENARSILPAILAGRWNDRSEGDRAALSQLAGRPYEEVAAELARWSNSSDPPVRRVGDVWMVVAKDDAWSLVARHVAPDDLNRFAAVTEQVIGSEDPTIDLPRTERLMAPLLGKRREHSGHLVEGLADTLALLGATSELIALPDGRRGQQVGDRVARALLDNANEDASGRRWITIAPSLPLLAEAAPDVFLSAAEQALSGDDPLLLKLFEDRDGFDSFFGNSAHSSLLWALENLAWSREYLGRASLLLAKLTRLDPGGRLGNRPGASLRDVLLLWRPGTSATLDERLQVVELIRRREPEIAWGLILKLLPSGHESATNTHAPVWRNWKPDDQRVLYADLIRVVRALAEFALEDVGTNGHRWAALLHRVADLPNEVRTKLIAKLTDSSSQFNEGDRAVIVAELRRMIGTHREFAGADWALPADDVNTLEEALPRLEPASPLLRHAWLFQPGALQRSRGKDLDSRRDELAEAQRAAIEECVARCGIECVLEWADDFESNGYSQLALGWALAAACVHDSDTEIHILESLISTNAKRRMVASAYVGAAARSHREDLIPWAASLLTGSGSGWGAAHKASFLAALPPCENVWSFVESLGNDFDREYWQLVGPYALPSESSAHERAARKLIYHGRAYAAIELLDAHADTSPNPPVELIAEALERALHTELPGPFDSMFSYHVDRHLNRLAEAEFDEQRLARLEWGYLPLFRYENRQMRVLHRVLATDPGFFAEVASFVYRAEGEEPRDLSQEEEQRAATARDLLASWHQVAGMAEDGSIDTAALNEWVDSARELLARSGRQKIGDHQIGQVLRYGPAARGDQWPADSICDLIERVASPELESGFHMEVYNSRGVTMRGQTEGGLQERHLAERYQRFSTAAVLRWPRTAALLKRLAESYEADARRNDLDADLTEDLWR